MADGPTNGRPEVRVRPGKKLNASPTAPIVVVYGALDPGGTIGRLAEPHERDSTADGDPIDLAPGCKRNDGHIVGRVF
jgi:hypothetical protein